MYLKRFSILVFTAVLALIVFSFQSVNAQEWYRPDQATVGWDEVTTFVRDDGTTGTIPAEDTVYYTTYIRNEYTGVEVVASPEIVDLQYVFTFPSEEGMWRVGVQAVREVAGEEELDPIRSAISWSDDTAVVNSADGIFGFVMHFRPSSPMNLRRIQ